MAKKIKNNKKKLLLMLLILSLIWKALSFIFSRREEISEIKDNIKEFVKTEKREVNELKTGKESITRYCRDAGTVFYDYFIPHEGNGHKPKILRTKSLAIVVVLALFLKIVVAGYLFFIYPNEAEMQQQMTKEILALINEERNGNNLPELAANNILDTSALAKAEDMSIHNYFAHYSPAGKKPWDWISRQDYAYLLVGENLAINFTSAQAVHEALMNSESHKKNILNEKYKDIGLAVVSGEIDGERTNILVQIFAVRQAPGLLLAAAAPQIAGTTEPAAASPQAPAVVAPAAAKPEPVAEPAPAEKKTVPGPEPAATMPAPLVAALPETTAEEINITASETTAATDEAVEPRVIMFGEGEPVQNLPFLTTPEISPNSELAAGEPTTVQYFTPKNNKKIGIATRLVAGSKYAYIAALALMRRKSRSVWWQRFSS